MSYETAAQGALYTALNGAMSCDVYDDVPALPEGLPNSDFPYCNIGNDTAIRWDNDSKTGAVVTMTIHHWSRARGFKEVKGLMGEAYDLLHRATLTASGYTVLDCLWEFSEAFVDPDGETRHGVQRYRLTMQKGT